VFSRHVQQAMDRLKHQPKPSVDETAHAAD
jgi:hypothetical protein